MRPAAPDQGVAAEPPSALRRWAPNVVAVAFLTSGVIHLVRPQTFIGIVPHPLPHKRDIVYASGVVELTCALGLLRRARWAPVASAALLLAVWPANLQVALDAQGGDNTIYQLVAWARMPVQVPLIWAAWQGRHAIPECPQRKA